MIEIAAAAAVLVAAVMTGLFTLGGVAVGAILTPYFETRWARSLRAHQIRIDSLVELHDTYDRWIEAVGEYRSVRIVYLDRGGALSTKALLEFNRRFQEYTRLENRVYALLARLDDKELSIAIANTIQIALALLQDDRIHNLDDFQQWMIDASGSVSTRIGKSVAAARRG